MAIAETAIVIMSLVTIASLVWALYETFKGRDEEKPNAPFILNFASHDCNKRFEGREIESKVGAHGRHIITYRPKDIDIKGLKRLELKRKLEPQKAIVEDGKLVVIPAGQLSQDKTLKIILADRAEEYDPSIKTTPFGMGLAWASEQVNLDKTVEKILRESSLTKDEMLSRLNDGEMTREMLSTMDSLLKDSLKLRINEHDKKEKQTYISPPGVQYGSGQ